jgi:hypothetical protein
MTDTKQAKTSSNGTSAPRGALIVVEGLDRSGKSTQLTKMVEALKGKGVSRKRCSTVHLPQLQAAFTTSH